MQDNVIVEHTKLDYEKLDKAIALIGDFLLLNMAWFLSCYLLGYFEEDTFVPNSILLYTVYANVAYIPALLWFELPYLPNKLTITEILTLSTKYITLHALCYLSCVAFTNAYMARSQTVLFFALFLVFIFAWHSYISKYLKQLHESGKYQREIVIVGSGEVANELIGNFEKQGSNVKIVGIYDENGVSDLINQLPSDQVQELFCTLPYDRKEDIDSLIRFCTVQRIKFRSIPYIRSYVKRTLELQYRHELPTITFKKTPLDATFNACIKRTFDIFISAIFLCLVFPWVFIIVAPIIKLTSSGPIFFKQKRNGKGGNIFTCYKFRSMKENQDSDSMQATEDDPRKTNFGNFLRKTNIDELPQFINVLKGDMSIIGPRPHMLKITDKYAKEIKDYYLRLLVKPGITGWAQVHGYRGETKTTAQMQQRVMHDIWYIDHWTFWLDLNIILRTILNVFKGDKNAY